MVDTSGVRWGGNYKADGRRNERVVVKSKLHSGKQMRRTSEGREDLMGIEVCKGNIYMRLAQP